jgi:L-threonylcarbamoyladenylate synthase
MKTEIVKIDPARPEPEKMEYCGAVIRYGGLVAFPTETVYGLGANAFDAKSVGNIFEAKGRPGDNPLIVHVANYETALRAGRFSSEHQQELFYALGARFWPGPLTMIIHRKDIVPYRVTCGLETVGIRMPANKVARELILRAGVPIAAPSANLSGRPSPTRASHVIEDMKGRVDVIIDGGDCEVGVESTVVDLCGTEPVVLRPGFVTKEDIARVAGQCGEFDWRFNEGAVDRPPSPGMKYRHYAPGAEMILYEGNADDVAGTIRHRISEEKSLGKRVGVLATQEHICYYKDADAVLSLGPAKDGAEHARALFDSLRQFDARGVDVIFAESTGCEGVDDAVMNRMFRAAGGKTEKAFG